jgi:hypothetical protein
MEDAAEWVTLESLDAEARTVFVLREVFGLGLTEVADLLGRSRGRGGRASRFDQQGAAAHRAGRGAAAAGVGADQLARIG